MDRSDSTPAISVVIVCDYASGAEGGRSDLRRVLKAMAEQDLQEPAEFILSESESLRGAIPADILSILPALKVLFTPVEDAHALKNAGVEAASCELVAMIDADCLPTRDWLRLLLDSLRRHPEAVAVSGKTIYPGEAFSVRICSLLSRAYLDPGHEGPTHFISDNNAGYRRTPYLANPMATDMGGFTAHVQASKFVRQGSLMWFDPRFQVEHNFEGWPMERDVRRNRGYGTIKSGLMDRSLRYSWVVRAGRMAILPLIGWKILSNWRDTIRCWRSYGVRWHEVPVVMMASVGINLLEIPGMLTAFRGSEFRNTYFR